MTPDTFAATPAVSAEWTPPVAALWWAAKGDWEAAHSLVQSDSSVEAAWVHAYLHRVEGDGANAAYWYRRAGKPSCDLSLPEEWRAIAASLLAQEMGIP